MPLQKTILTHAHWTVEQKKMSKSVGNVADPVEAMNEFGIDVVRFYLARVGGKFRDDTGKYFAFRSLATHPQSEQIGLVNNFRNMIEKYNHCLEISFSESRPRKYGREC
jgi:methionyl-tRNA synthetase